jgi:alpha-L-rhamnosidase
MNPSLSARNAGLCRRVLTALAAAALTLNLQASTRVLGLRCEHLENPLGIDANQPRLSWKLESSERAQGQTAYRVLVASSPENLKWGNLDLWDNRERPV